MQKALYRKYRSRNFDEVYGQEHITSVLKHECASGKVSHAYLFCGSRGTGKTSCSKILAKAANCLDPKDGNPCGVCDACRAIDEGFATDVLEMDAASNNGVDNIRDIRDEVVFAPSTLKYRVYIIDEVHMLSASAFNALLKTLEEPPEHCIFILATTELHKLPSTIISRCQRFDFRRISIENISKRLHYIADHEDIIIDDASAFSIAKYSAGGMRDAISLFELCASTNRNITLDVVESVIGSSGRDTVEQLVRSICEKDHDSIFGIIHSTVMGSKELNVLWQELMDYYRDMLVCKYAPDPMKYLDLTDIQMKTLSENASRFSKADILYQSGLLENAYFDMLRSPSSKRSVAELTLIRLCDASLDTSSEALLKRLEILENKIAELSYNGVPTAAGVEVKTVTGEKKVAQVESSKAEEKVISKPAEMSTATRATAEVTVEKPAKKARFRQTAELIERLKTENLMLASFVEQSRIMIDESGKYCFIVGSRFTEGRLKDGAERIAKALSPITGTQVTKDDISVTIGSTDKEDPLDEI